MHAPRKTDQIGALAFTLIELLVVITVISLLLAFSAPALFNGLQASRLSGAGEQMVSALSDAQQTAFSQNCVVEIQFYSYEDAFGGRAAFRSYRFFKVANVDVPAGGTEEVKTNLGALTKFPDGVMISPDPGLSPALEGELLEDTQNNAGVPNARYASIRFLPDGTCRQETGNAAGMPVLAFLTLPESFFTLVEDDGHDYTAAPPPNNFYTIQTDPFTGKSRSYRPGF